MREAMTEEGRDERELQHGRLISLRVPQRLARAIEQDAGNHLLSVSARCRQLLAEGVGYRQEAAQ
jgi:hypothetical protein